MRGRHAQLWAGPGMTALDLFNLSGRIALVSGASRGIGHAIATGLAEAGATTFGLARSPAPADGAYAYRQCDVTDVKEVAALMAEVFAAHGRIDILVNAAGITLPGGVAADPAEAFRQTLAANLTAVYDCCRLVVPYMQKGGGGSIVNVTSIGAEQGFPGNPGYAAAKGGLAAMTRALAVDYGPSGIRVNNLAPGYVRTAMTEASHSDPGRHAARAARTILGRWGRAEEMVGAAIFLASSASSYVTGTDLFVDGGWTAKGL